MRAKQGLSIEKEEEIIEFFKNGVMTVPECARHFNIKLCSVKNLFFKNKIKVKKEELKKIKPSKEIEICELYQQGVGAYTIAKDYKTSSTEVYRILTKYEIEIRDNIGSNRKLSFDFSYFKTIDSEEKAYFLGFIVADGCNTRHGLKISIQERDGYILEKLKKSMRYTGVIRIYDRSNEGNHQNLSTFSISAIELSRDLSKLGVIPNKSHFTRFPDIPEELWSHFIRGVFDGDGSSYKSKSNTNCSFSICGTKELLTKIQQILIENCLLNKIKIYQQKGIYCLTYSGANQCKKIYDYLYKDCREFYLTRKKEKLEKIWSK